MSHQSVLQTFGLTPRQAEIYLALRKHGQLPVLELARRTGIPRVSVYAVVDELARLGIVSQITKNKRKIVEAHAPRMLLAMLEKKLLLFQGAIPLLESLGPGVIEEASFQYYVGNDQSRQGQIDFYEDLARQKVKLVRSFAHSDLVDKFPKFLPAMIKRRREMGIATQLLVPGGTKAASTIFRTGEDRELRYLPARFPFNCNCLIGGSSILFIVTQQKEPTVILMRSKPVSGLLAACFSFIWEQVG